MLIHEIECIDKCNFLWIVTNCGTVEHILFQIFFLSVQHFTISFKKLMHELSLINNEQKKLGHTLF